MIKTVNKIIFFNLVPPNVSDEIIICYSVNSNSFFYPKSRPPGGNGKGGEKEKRAQRHKALRRGEPIKKPSCLRAFVVNIKRQAVD